MFESLKELFSYRSMIRNLVKREIRGRYKGSILGFVWNFLVPLVQILVYIMVFTQIFRSNIDHYAIYLVSGIIFWNWFSESATEGSGTIIANGDMVKKIYFPRSVLPLTMTISKMVNFFIMLMVFFVILIIVDHGFSPIALLGLPAVILISFVFIAGITLLLSSIDVYIRDTQYLVNVLMMAWIWITPIMYNRDFIENDMIQNLLALNPMTYFVSLFQDILYWKQLPDAFDVLICVILAVAMMIIGAAVFKHLEKDFAEVL